MTDQTHEVSKPVRCGCGGEPVVGHIEKTSYLPKDRWYIGCPKCDICTGIYDTEAEAVEAWNKAMGDRKKGEWNDKAVYNREGIEMLDEWQTARCSVCGKYHTTPFLYNFNNYPFCPNCGAEMKEGDHD